MNPNMQFSWTLAQTGKVSVSHQRMRGMVMSKVQIECDLTSDSLLSDIAQGDTRGDVRGRKTWLSSELEKSKEIKVALAAARASESADGGGGRSSGGVGLDSGGVGLYTSGVGRNSGAGGRNSGGVGRNIDGAGRNSGGGTDAAPKRLDLLHRDKTLVMRVKTAEVKDNKLVVTNGEIKVQGETVILKDGVPYFNGKSHMGPGGSKVGPPFLTGSKVDIKRMEALVSKSGIRNLYFSNSELMDSGQRSIILNPEIHLSDLVIPIEPTPSKKSTAEELDSEALREILPNHEQVLAEVTERRNMAERQSVAEQAKRKQSKSPSAMEDDSGELNQVVLMNGRCVLKDNCVVVLRGVLHAGSAWHQVSNGLLGGSGKDANLRPVTISGTPVYRNEVETPQSLLDNVLLYSRGSTLYAGNTPLLTGAMLHADGYILDVADLRYSAVGGLEPPPESEPARLFLQGGKFMVDETGLTILEGTVWLKELKLQLPEDSFDEVNVQDSVIFYNLETDKDGAVKATVFEGRDLIYKNNMLLLDDLTPLLKGGFICHEDKKQPLAWLSSDPNAVQRAIDSESFYSTTSEEAEDRADLLTEGTCIVDETGLYFIEGSMIVNGKKVVIDKGVPLFSSDSAKERKSQNIAVQPPRLTGQLLLDPDTVRELGGTSVNGRVVLRNVKLDMIDGTVMVNQKVPIMKACKLRFDSRVFRPSSLGVKPGTETEPSEDNKESGIPSDAADFTRAHEIDKTRGQSVGRSKTQTGERVWPADRSGGKIGGKSGSGAFPDQSDDARSPKGAGSQHRGARESDGAERGHRPKSSADPSGSGAATDGEEYDDNEVGEEAYYEDDGTDGKPGSGRTTDASGGVDKQVRRPMWTDGYSGQGPTGKDGRGGQRPTGPNGYSGQQPEGTDGYDGEQPTETDGYGRQQPIRADGHGGQKPTGRDGSVDPRPKETATGQRPPAGLGSRSHDAAHDPDRFVRLNPFLDDDGKARMMRRVTPSLLVTEPVTGESFDNLAVPSSSTGILGNFTVSARGDRRLVFSLWLRIEETLRFLKMDKCK